MRTKYIFSGVLGFVLFCVPLFFFQCGPEEFVKQVGPLISCGFLENNYLYWMHHFAAGIPVLFFGVVVNLFGYRKVFAEKYLLPVFGLSLVFILWDILFNHWGIWGFNPRYYSGQTLAGLPVEEWIWFWVIPFCSLFVYEMVKGRMYLDEKVDRRASWILMPLLLVFYILNMDQLYSSWSLAAALFTVSLSIVWSVKGIAIFLVSFLLNMIPMYLFNGMLTGLITEEALVMYNPEEFSNLRLGSFPVEDLGFGFAYLYGIVMVSGFINSKKSASYTV